jgi:phenylacetate-CoA ligase
MSYSLITGLPEFKLLTVLDPLAAQRLVLVQQLQASERLPLADITAQQDRQLCELLRYVAVSSPRFKRLLADRLQTGQYGQTIGAANARTLLQSLPPLQRTDLQETVADVACHPAPPHHGALHLLQTSGSSGEPVQVKVTDAALLIRNAVMLRSFLWHLPDFDGRLAIISAKLGKDDPERLGSQWNGWDNTFFPLYQTGDAVGMNVQTDIERQLAWLDQTQPSVLITYPSNLQQLLLHAKVRDWRPQRLKHIRLNGETVLEDVLQQARQAWGVSVSSLYSSEEAGPMAVQCPKGTGLHMMAESVILEVVRADGSPCQPGELGRVLVTDLHNFATPLIRYEIKDMAVLGTPCSCGCHLPVLASVQGRYRNMLMLPDGRRYWPRLGLRRFGKLAPIKQFQVLQQSLALLQVKVLVTRALSASEREAVVLAVKTAVGHPFAIELDEFTHAWALPASGKFEEFVSLLP